MNTKPTITNTGIVNAGEFAPAPSLNIRESKIVIASQSARCADIMNNKGPEVKAFLIKALDKFQAVTGFKRASEAGVDEKTVILQAMMDVVKRYKWLRIDELKFILDEGMIGEYGDFFSFDARTLNGWIKAYYDKERGKALKKQLEYTQKQTDLEEESRKKKNQEQAVKANREQFIQAYLSLAQEHAEAIETGELTYVSIPVKIDPKNVLFYAFQKKWDNKLGFPVEKLKQILEQEMEMQKLRLSTSGDWVKMKDEKALVAAAQSNARSKTFRMRIALMLMSGVDIEEFIKEHDI